MKFLCDEMLKGLGRWLRAAGYDTLLMDDGEADSVLLQRARNEGRLFLTRDRQLLEHKGADDTVVLLACNGLEDCAAELSRRLAIDWQYRPFSRCMVCNSLLEMASQQQRTQIPADAQEDDLVLYCPRCEQLYWEGSHVTRMRARLQCWAAGEFLPH